MTSLDIKIFVRYSQIQKKKITTNYKNKIKEYIEKCVIQTNFSNKYQFILNNNY